MSELIFNGKIALTTGSGLTTMKVDVLRHESSVEIRLIDTTNIFTLFVCTITQSDFYILKRDQDILVDYDRFVHVLANLFHSLSTSRLSATLNDGALRFIENSEFRNICKLELQFSKPEESQYRRYLADLLSRMEGDNVKLIKENSILRDKCVNGDRVLRDRLRSAEAEVAECRRRMELQSKDMAVLESRCHAKEEEVSQVSNRLFSLENENSHLKYELERYQKENSQSYKDQLRSKEEELETSLREIKTANEIIRKLREENAELKDYKMSNLNSIQRESDKYEEVNEKYISISRKYKSLEEKYRHLKEESRGRESRIQELEASNKGLAKKLENAQNVYNHFYSKRVEEGHDHYSDTFSLRPESPPSR